MPDGQIVDLPTDGAIVSIPSVSERARANQVSMASGAAKKQYDTAQADAQADINTHLGRVAKDVVMAGGAALAAPLTGGTSLLAAAGIMAGAGATSSLVAEGVKKVMGSREVAKNFKDLAWTTGFDAATFAGGEVGGRAVGAFLKGALPRMIMKSAAKVSAGQDALDTMAERTLYGLEGRLQASVGAKGAGARTTLDVDIGDVMKRTEQRIADLPKGAKGEFGDEFGSLRAKTEEVSGKIQRGLQAKADTPGLVREQAKATRQLAKANAAVQNNPQSGYHAAVRQKVKEDAAALVEKVTARLEAAKGADSTTQPLDVLIKIKGEVQAFGYEHPNWREGKVFKRMGAELDARIKSSLKTTEERELYNHYNTIVKAQNDNAKVLQFTNDWVKQVARRSVGAVIGGGLGFETGGVQGAAAGAAIGLAAPNVSAFILHKTATNPRTGALLRKAVDTWVQGNAGAAKVLAGRAFAVAGGRQIIEHLVENPPDLQPQEQVAPSKGLSGSGGGGPRPTPTPTEDPQDYARLGETYANATTGDPVDWPRLNDVADKIVARNAKTKNEQDFVNQVQGLVKKLSKKYPGLQVQVNRGSDEKKP